MYLPILHGLYMSEGTGFVEATGSELRWHKSNPQFPKAHDHLECRGRLEIEVNRKQIHYPLFVSQYPLEHKLGLILTLHYQVEKILTYSEAKIREEKHSHFRGHLAIGAFWTWASITSYQSSSTAVKVVSVRSDFIERDESKSNTIMYPAGQYEL